MKEAEEIVKYLDLEFDSEINRKYYSNIIASAIKQAQVDAWNEALGKAAENADADIYFKGWLAEQEPFVEGEDYEVYVLNQSILKLKL